MSIFCDYLTVTCHPDSSFVPALSEWLTGGYPVRFSQDGVTVWNVGSGKIDICEDLSGRFHKAGASGRALHELRRLGEFDDYLSFLGSVPHRVTRLDAALDVDVDAPVILRQLERRYPDDLVCLTRKSVKVTRMYSTRSDGQLSGTWYVGHKSRARVTARVYDKTLETFEREGAVIPPTTRYELTFGRDHGCTLRDAYMPKSLFYEYASPKLVDRPPDHVAWVPQGDGWESDPVDREITFEVFLRRVENSPELVALERMASALGPEGVELYLSTVRRRMISTFDDSVDAA